MLKGHFPPIPTPFEEGAFCARRMAENVARWNAEPIDGCVVLGSNGEAPLIDEEERGAVIRAVAGAMAGGRKVIVGAGRESTRATIRCVVEAFDLGADAVLVGVPAYYRPAMTDEVLRDHYLRVADASPGPVLLYSVPAFTGLPISVRLFTDLISHDRVIGIKESSGDAGALRALAASAAAARREVSVLVGSARVLAEGLEAGAAGSVLAVGCVAARPVRRCADLVAAGDHAGARRMNEALAPLAAAVTVRHGIGGLKAALDLLGWHGGAPRGPLRPAGAAARAEIADLMRALGLFDGPAGPAS